MQLSSIHFLFLFLPIALILYFLLPFQRWRNLILLGVSLAFYAWGYPAYLLLLLGVILINWGLALGIGTCRAGQKAGWAKAVMIFGIIANLALLAFYKYTGFITANLGVTWNLTPKTLPLGISFFTFSAVSYLVDIYNEITPPSRNLIHFALYVALFPKILQGPITRYEQVESDLAQRETTLEDLADGSRRFIIGLAKKILIADQMAVIANSVFGVKFNLLGMDLAWYGLIAYTLQIYFDFSGYTDMAIGLGRIFGFHLPENFNYPYISRSISDFWRRWHMTLTAWFRSYVFYPLEFARKREKFLRQQSNLFIVFILTGLWHGASWNFVIWGGYFGLILALEASFLGKRLKKLPVFLQHFYSLLLIVLGWAFFRVENVGQWGAFFKALVGLNGWTGLENARTLNVLLFYPLMLVAIVGCTPLVDRLSQKLQTSQWGLAAARLVFLALFLLSVAFILTNGYQPLLYAQF